MEAAYASVFAALAIATRCIDLGAETTPQHAPSRALQAAERGKERNKSARKP